MPGPQAPYGNPGPSNYYHQPPPAVPPGPGTYAYGPPPMNGHSPAPGPGPYGYGYGGQHQHLNGHAGPVPGSPRGRGPYPDPGRGFHHHGGAHHQAYQHPVAQHPHGPPPAYLGPGPGLHSHSPQPQAYATGHHPHHPHAHHQKFSPYPPPHPAAAAAASAPVSVPVSVPAPSSLPPGSGPTAQPQQPPPLAAYHHPAPQNWATAPPISPLPKHLAMPPPPALSPLTGAPPRPRIFDGPMEAEDAPKPDAPASPSPPPSTTAPASPPALAISSSSAPATASSSSPSSATTAKASVSVPWAIWSRRPQDPSRAPGIIFSPACCPPPSIVQGAISDRTPPQSPRARSVQLEQPPLPPSTPPPEPPHEPPSAAESPTQAHARQPSESPRAPSSSTTDVSTTAPDTPIPGSPVSSSTSVSAPAANAATSPKAVPIVATPQEPVEPAPAPVTVPIPAAPKPAPPSGPKKSFAELLRSSGPSGLSSSVVGFSVPASPPPARVPPTRRTELTNLLSGRASQSLVPQHQFPPAIRPRGLVNSGNMCFANAVLQLLVYSQPFWRLFNDLGKLLPADGKEGDEGATPLVDATVKFLREFVWERKRGRDEDGDEEDGMDSFMPTYVYEAMKAKKRFDNMRGQHQQDAEEFFGFYLDTLEEELLALQASLNPAPPKVQQPKVEERIEETPPEEGWMEVGKKNRTVITRTVKSVESPITRIFGGKFRSTLRVPGLRDSVVVEDWRSLQLDIQKDTVNTIRDALAGLAQPQSVQVVSPTRPGTTVDAAQQHTIDALPPVLVLHLKRFLYDVGAQGVVKIGKRIAYGPELEIPSEVIAPAAGKRAGSRHYRLYGVLYHHGASAGGGHYTLDILHPNRDGVRSPSPARPREAWVRFDDELVSDVRAEDVFAAGASGGGADEGERCAYLLFYRQVASPGAAGVGR